MTSKTWEQKDYEAKCAEVKAAYRVIDALRSRLAARDELCMERNNLAALEATALKAAELTVELCDLPQAQDDKLTTGRTPLRGNETELPKPFFGMGRYLSIAGTRDAYTKGQLRDYGDKRAELEIERLNKQFRGLAAKLFKTVAECRTQIDALQAERDARP